MCTRAEGEKLRVVYDKYKVEQKVDPADLLYLDKLADAYAVKFRYTMEGMYARSV